MSVPYVADPRVFLHYTKSELDRNFDQRGWVTNASENIAAYQVMSAATRSKMPPRSIKYGPTESEVLDIFDAGDPQAPVNVFVHGGAWLNFNKDDFSFVAEALVPAGMTCVVLNFDKVPHVSLSDMVDQVRRGLAWTCRNLASDGGVYVSGWSSGAHLTAAALLDAQAELEGIRGGFFISGPFDLKPVMLSARSAYLKLTEDEILKLSPHHRAHDLRVPIFLASADGDTDEFRRQSKAFADAVAAHGRLRACASFENVNHFELVRTFGEVGSPLLQTFQRFVTEENARCFAERTNYASLP